MTKYIKWFNELHKEDVPIAGGKGANLGEMSNAKLPVPAGFVIVADAYKDIIKNIFSQINEKLKDLDVENNEALQNTTKEIREMILSEQFSDLLNEEITAAYSFLDSSAEIRGNKMAQALITAGRDPPFVAVRSSATAEDLPEASFAGQQKTLLNVKGNENLLKAVKECWASLFTARATYYRVKNNFPHDKVAIAVIVQKMVNSEKSGVMFSVNPVTNNTNEVVIEAIYGLGEAIVSGAVNPNTYIVDKKSGEITKKQIVEQTYRLIRDTTGKTVKQDIPDDLKEFSVLKEQEISILAKLALTVEKHYGTPQDMEWAIERGRLFIVQSRPVTTLKKRESVEEVKHEGAEILKGLGASPGGAAGPVKIIHSVQELDKIQKGDILVTEMTNPDMVPGMQRAAAIITDEGGLTCHAAIVSREMGTPAVVGTREATKKLKDDDFVTVDGSNGLVYSGKKSGVETAPKEIPEAPEHIPKTKTKIKTIMDLPDFAERAAKTKAEGIGLLRIEGIIASGKIHPVKYLKDGRIEEYIQLLVDGITKIATPFKEYPVWVRTSDLRTDEYRGLEGGEEEPKEKNPMLGWHAIRRSLDQPELLKAEFTALKRVREAGLKNVGVMLPFIISVEEVKKAKEIMRQVGLEPQKDIEFGIMIETPASVLIINKLCDEGIDFISFGTNDLTQTVLGVDRGNEKIAKLYDWMHPAVLLAIKHVLKTCKEKNVKTSICGQAGSEPKMVKFLVENKIDSVSANADAINKVREIIYDTERTIL